MIYKEEKVWVKILRISVSITLSIFYTSIILLTFLKDVIFKGFSIFDVAERKRPECMDKYNHGYLQLKTVKLHYVSAGDKNKPVLLFIHGFPEIWFSWRYQISEFEKDYYVVAIDQRGYGSSDKPSGIHNYTIEMLTNDIKEVIDKLGVKKASVIGHDWGSIVAWSFGIYYPEMVEKLVIMDVPHPVVGGKYYQSNIQQFLRAWYIFFFQFPIVPELSMMVNDMKLLETMFRGKKGGIINRENFTDEDMAVYKYTFGQKGSLTYPINFYRGMLQRWSLIDFPKTLVQPDTLIIWGEKDHFVNSEMAQLSAKYCKNATVKLIPNSSHWVQQDSPVEVNNAMRAFLTAK